MGLDRDTTFTWYGHACFEVRTPGGKVILIDPWFRQPAQPALGRLDRALRPAAGDPWPRRSHGRCRRAGQPASARLAVHPRDEPVARPPAARRRRRGDRHEQGRDGGRGRPADHHGPCRSFGRRLEPGRRDDPLPGRAGRLRGRAGERLPLLPCRRHERLRRHAPDRRAVPTGYRDAADRRPFHDGTPPKPPWPWSCSASGTSSRSTTGRSRSWPGRRISCVRSWPQEGWAMWRSTRLSRVRASADGSPLGSRGSDGPPRVLPAIFEPGPQEPTSQVRAAVS